MSESIPASDDYSRPSAPYPIHDAVFGHGAVNHDFTSRQYVVSWRFQVNNIKPVVVIYCSRFTDNTVQRSVYEEAGPIL